MCIRKSISGLILVTSLSTHALAEVSGPVEVVAKLYREYAWEAVIDSPDWDGHRLLEQPRAVLERYFEARLAGLIVRERECAIRTREICALDFSPIWAAQDPGATAMKISPGASPSVVDVHFRYPGDGTKIRLSYRMIRTPAGWRIADIVHPDWTLLSALSRLR